MSPFVMLQDPKVIAQRIPRNTLTRDQNVRLIKWIVSLEKRPSGHEIVDWVRESLRKQLNPAAIKIVDHIVYELVTQESKRVLKEAGDSTLELPGFGLPLAITRLYKPDGEFNAYFPILSTEVEGWGSSALIDKEPWTARTLSIREVCMLAAVEELTNKPEWWIKCRDPEIAARWKDEALALDWASIRTHADFTPAMADAVIEELRHKATLYEDHGLIPVLDYCIAAIKSDKILTDDLLADLKAAVTPLENVPEELKDWHPGSNKQVLDLVHPSLWPLVYGKSRILPHDRVGVQDALDHCGSGFIIPERLPVELSEVDNYSTRFQWLPSDVSISPDGKAKFESYVNNLHPVEHAKLYPVLEKLIEKALPAWDALHRWPREFDMQRLEISKAGTLCSTPKLCEENYECAPANRPLNEGEEPRGEDERYEEGYEESARGLLDMAWFQSTHQMDLPDPDPTKQPVLIKSGDIRTFGFFDRAPRIQVIVKLANIHLTPDSPSYAGGSWHVEGMMNEHICATALYYYDSDNITDSRLDFRTRANREELHMNIDYEQSDDYSIQRTFAMDLNPGGKPSNSAVQNVGSVLTRPGRALFFPNLFQHHVSPFRLADPSKPGHRKIIALFLVDPNIPIISTANVPPQRKDWWRGEANKKGDALGKLPTELRDMVVDQVDFPYDKNEADKLREELMKERSAAVELTESHLTNIEYNFCEH
ncbi:WD40 repeat 2 [Sarocladium implicatum]|nr:WD40 repeat 2 [Sarocladium implicatum]